MICCDSFALPDMGARVEYNEILFHPARYHRVPRCSAGTWWFPSWVIETNPLGSPSAAICREFLQYEFCGEKNSSLKELS